MDGRLDFYPRPSPFKMSRHPPLRTPNTRTRTLSSPTTATPPIARLTFQHNVPTSPANGKAISALDMITEGVLFFISIYIVTGLGMSSTSKQS
jgi:ABC-type Na+ efflux pump permease subunit